MRFLPDGPDIPDDLIAAQERGQAIFICGAGVSMSLGLPSFGGLVEKVYASLGEDWRIHLAEREVMVDGGKLFGQYDRVLRSLERRLVGGNPGRSNRMKERIRAAVRAALVPPTDPPPDLSNHEALLELSRDADGSIRLVTTNFDTLFERAWSRPGEAPSFAGASMPQPKAAGCAGVLHVHGRLRDDELGLAETDLVLTSAEFGDAYLRSGWASRYIYDLARAYTVVLVGYQADDPPMRYLLEVLEADRERYPDLQYVYAFSSPDEDTALTEALWKAKGVRPIIHNVDGHNYAPLWNSIREWRAYQADPTGWRRVQLNTLMAEIPHALGQAETARVIALLSHGDASLLLAELSPSAAWLPVLVQGRVFDNGKASPGEWLAKHLDDPDMIRAAAALNGLDEGSVWFLERAIDQSRDKLAPVRVRAWELILSAKRKSYDPDRDLRWYRIAKRIRRGEADYEARRLVSSLVKPRLTIQRPYSLYETDEPDEGPETLDSLVWLTFKSSQSAQTSEILNTWPQEREPTLALIDMLQRTLTDALEHAEAVGFIRGWDRADQDVPSVAQHRQNSYRQDFYPIVRLIADLWERVKEFDEEVARHLASNWSASRFTLFKRLALFAQASPVVSAETAAQTILDLTDTVFWASGAQVEIMRSLVQRWPDLPPEDRRRIEVRLRAGIPRGLFEARELDEDQWNSIFDSSIYRRLKRLENAGHTLEAVSQRILAEISARHPSWRPSPGERDDFNSWSETSTGPDGNPALLKDVPDEALVAEALKIQRERMFDQGDLWRKFCASDPERALRGLIAQAQDNKYDVEAWRALLWETDERADEELQTLLAEQIFQLPDDAFYGLRGTIADWIRRKRNQLDKLRFGGINGFWAFWDRLRQFIFVPADADKPVDEDVSMSALNSPAGVLAWALCDALGEEEREPGTGLGDLEHRFNALVEEQGRLGLLARYHFARHLAYISAIAPGWIEERLVSKLRWENAEATTLWGAASQSDILSAKMLNTLIGDLQLAVQSGRLNDYESQNLTGWLFQIIVWQQLDSGKDYAFDAAGLKSLLTRSPAQVRQDISWMLWRLAEGVGEGTVNKVQRWRELVGPIFRAIWPLDIELRTSEISSRLVNMVLDMGEAFPEAVETIADILVPYQLFSMQHSLHLEDRHADIHKLYPRAYLILLNAILDPRHFPVPADLGRVLTECMNADPSVVEMAEYRRLDGFKRQAEA